MDVRHLAADKLVFYFVLYGCLPLWVIMGFVDWVCHRRSRIETSSGLAESVLHSTMGVQIGIPIFLGLFFEVNVLLLLTMIFILVVHEYVADMDVRRARDKRDISMLEMHVHSFMEVIPFVVVALVVCLNWSAFLDLVTFHWGGHMGLVPKAEPFSRRYIAGYLLLMLGLGVCPYLEEMWRCWRYQRR